jgi:3-dehydroquinate synthase class II
MPVRATKSEIESPAVHAATVVDVLDSGEIAVRIDGRRGHVVCDFLETGRAEHPSLQAGDRVMLIVPDGGKARPAVVGKIGAYRRPDRRQVVIEADEELIVRCGEASVTFRKAGQILLRGMDIVSSARKRNRLRGGSVQIN